MKLVSFSAKNYRSITSAHKIALSDVTTLIGRNNEGKSNLLKALGTAMVLLQNHAAGKNALRRVRTLLTSNDTYQWKRDFPIQLQNRKFSAHTVLTLEFQLADDELIEFYSEIKSNLNGLLPLEIMLGKDNEPQFRVIKSGKGTKSLTQKSERIAQFIASRIHFNYIPAIRTEKDTLDLIGILVEQELKTLEDDSSYKTAMDTIAKLQKPILDNLSIQVKDALHEFLPNIRSVQIDLTESTRRYNYRREVNVIVDDGVATNIEQKGDGVKSLAALGLLKSKNAKSGASILAIEEPESHLHPAAIHQVNEIIQSISQTSQVLIATHNPLFVNRSELKSNVIVTDGGATPAKNIAQIRDLLGIKASDNLINASYALVVEGAEDAKALKAILPTLSDKLGKALKQNFLVIDYLGGSGKLSYKLSVLKNALCATHTLLDDDQAGIDAYNNAKNNDSITPAECTFTKCKGRINSEFEDLISIALYKEAVLKNFGVDISDGKLKGKNKWSQRIESLFKAQGKQFNDQTLTELKKCIGQEIEKNPGKALDPNQRESVDALVKSLERLVNL